ncbi:hypothetical protein ACFE04_023081 [Oxalis oulophora]
MNYRPSLMCDICRERFLPTQATTTRCVRCTRVLLPTVRPRWEDSNGIQFREGSFAQKIGFQRPSPSKMVSKNFTTLNSTPSAWEAAPPRVTNRPNKRALICGVSYKKGKHKLNGTFNDVKNFRDLLIDNFGFRPDNILVLSEEEQDQRLMPTRKNIVEGLQWLVQGCQSGDSLVFYFSGHGLRQPDFSDDELDGFDETICPVDFMEAGMILDNDINRIIVSPLKEGVTLHAIVDACHSGTILDLENVYDKQKKEWIDNCPPSKKCKGTKGGLAISISACDDAEFAADTSEFSSGKTMNGAMTYLLIDAIRTGQSNASNITYGDLLDKIYRQIEQVTRTGCFGNATVLRGLFGKKIIQKPQLSASKRFKVYEKEFIL